LYHLLTVFKYSPLWIKSSIEEFLGRYAQAFSTEEVLCYSEDVSAHEEYKRKNHFLKRFAQLFTDFYHNLAFMECALPSVNWIAQRIFMPEFCQDKTTASFNFTEKGSLPTVREILALSYLHFIDINFDSHRFKNRSLDDKSAALNKLNAIRVEIKIGLAARFKAGVKGCTPKELSRLLNQALLLDEGESRLARSAGEGSNAKNNILKQGIWVALHVISALCDAKCQSLASGMSENTAVDGGADAKPEQLFTSSSDIASEESSGRSSDVTPGEPVESDCKESHPDSAFKRFRMSA
jgi:hypothetical protein